jgi:hypothetical protein
VINAGCKGAADAFRGGLPDGVDRGIGNVARPVWSTDLIRDNQQLVSLDR